MPIVSKDGITINKAADSEKIEISGSGCVQNSSKQGYVVYTRENNVNGSRTFATQPFPNSFPIWNANNELEGNISDSSTDNTLTNKKYVDDNYVKKDTKPARVIYAHESDGKPIMLYPQTGSTTVNEWWLPIYVNTDNGDSIVGNGVLLTNTPTKPYQCANKHYVDEAVTNAVIGDIVFKTLFSNHQSIVGQGNIDLYKHHVAITVNYIGADYVFYTDIYSSMNFTIDSLTNLKTYLGDDFVQGFYGANRVVITSDLTRYAIQGTLTPTTFYWPVDSKNSYHLEETPISDITITDTVTTI